MTWLSKLLGFKDIVMPDVGKLLEDSRKESIELFSVMKGVKGKDISEPVFAMLNAWKQNPKRFKVSIKLDGDVYGDVTYNRRPSATMSVYDTDGKEEFVFLVWLKDAASSDMKALCWFFNRWFAQHTIYPILGMDVYGKPSWMTQGELDFIIETVKPYYLKRVNRYRDIVESRIDRTRKANEMKSEIAKQKERDRLMGVYK